MATFKPTSPVVGINLDSLQSASDGPQFALGTEVTDQGGRTWQYVQSNTAIAKNLVVHIQTSKIAAALTPALAITAGRLGVANATAFTTSTYGWVVVNGPATVFVMGSCGKDVPLYTTDNAGILDDATVSLSQHQIQGVVLVSLNSASTTNTAPAIMQFPSVRRPAT